MGMFFNPGNESFAKKRSGEYIDKSGLISVINDTIGRENSLTCASRARRFGKTYAASMLAAYYDKSCDSSALFDDLEIAGAPTYREYLNRFDVLYLDIAFLMESADREEADFVQYMENSLCRELCELYPSAVSPDMTVTRAMLAVTESERSRFFAVIDEWDAPVRDADITEKSRKRYMGFLRSLFKNANVTDRVFAGAYMTGILPVKKDDSQTALSDFDEYSMLEPGKLAPYIGFTEEEVRGICAEKDVSFEKMKEWYDGYALASRDKQYSIYNANSVMQAIKNGECKSYWRKTAAANILVKYINMDFDGLSAAAEKLLAGLEIPVRTSSFDNDIRNFTSADDVLTLLIHLGYLTYSKEHGSVRVPNQEVMLEFADMIHSVTRSETIKRVDECERLLKKTVEMDVEYVADAIQKLHMQESSMKYYNNEQALRAIIKLAYFTYHDHYIKLEELDSGVGYADVVFIPKKYDRYPAMVVELKYHSTAQSGIDQIKDRNYPEVLKNYGSEILLVCVSYHKDDVAKKHTCIIERLG